MPVEVASLGSYDFSESAGSRHSDWRMPNLLWSRTYGHPLLTESVRGLIETSQGDFALYGYAERNETGGPWLLTTDSAGTPIWNQTYLPGLSTARTLVEVSNGGYAMTATRYQACLGYYRAFTWVLRIDANGSLRWSSQLNSLPLIIVSNSLLETRNGGFLILGTIAYEEDHFHPMAPNPWLAYVNSSGAALWNQTLSIPSMPMAFPVGMVRCKAGGYALAVTGYNEVLGRYELWFARADESGMLLWNKTVDIDAGARSLQECADGGFVLAGIAFAYNETTEEAKGTATLVRLDAEANLLWNETYPSVTDDRPGSVVERGVQGYAMAGSTRVPGTEDLNVWIAFVDTNGRMLRNYTYGGPGEDLGWSIVACAAGGYAVAGVFGCYTGEGLDTSDALLLRLAEPEFVPPVWRTPPTNQSIPYGLPFVYHLAAEDASGLDTWWLRDTSFFVIDQAGTVSSVTSLALGAYPVAVCVNDTSGNLLLGSFTLLVLPSALIIPGYPWTILGLIVIIVLVIAWRRHH